MVLTKSLKFCWLVIVVAGFASCAAPEKIIYFQEKQDYQDQLNGSYNSILKKDDLLAITVSALDFDAAKPFNQAAEGEQSGQQGYLIDSEGAIEFPIIGKVKLAGLTKAGASDLLRKELLDYIKNPVVNVRIMNYKVTVLGEVSGPGTYTIPNERITLIEAIGLAGDLTINGVRENILVVREIEGKQEFYRVDITSKEVFNSPVYYLSQNDVVYVEPNKPRMNASKVSPTTGLVFSSIGLLLSIITLLLIRL